MNTNVHFSSATDMWATPQDYFDKLDNIFEFTLDPCVTAENAKCEKFFTEADNGLDQSWDGERVFMNPPYGRGIGAWVEKAAKSEALVVCLLPARTDTKWWQEYVIGGGATVHFIKGRLKFGDSKNSAPFPSAIVIFYGNIFNNRVADQ